MLGGFIRCAGGIESGVRIRERLGTNYSREASGR